MSVCVIKKRDELVLNSRGELLLNGYPVPQIQEINPHVKDEYFLRMCAKSLNRMQKKADNSCEAVSPSSPAMPTDKRLDTAKLKKISLYSSQEDAVYRKVGMLTYSPEYGFGKIVAVPRENRERHEDDRLTVRLEKPFIHRYVEHYFRHYGTGYLYHQDYLYLVDESQYVSGNENNVRSADYYSKHNCAYCNRNCGFAKSTGKESRRNNVCDMYRFSGIDDYNCYDREIRKDEPEINTSHRMEAQGEIGA